MEITITKALTDLKLYAARITRAISEGLFVGVQIGKNKINNYYTVEEFNTKAQGSKDSVEKLIERRNELKSALVNSNAVQKVVIGGKTYTVAAAIERKSNIAHDREYLEQLRSQFNASVLKVEAENRKVQDRLDKQIEKLLEGQDKKEKQAEIEALTKVINDGNQAVILDPLKIGTLIDKLQKDIEDFESEVDTALSVSNATTMVTVSDN